MAKTIKGATITFEVTSDGSLKVVEKEAKKAKKGLDGTSKSAGDVRRNMQAMSGRVESGSKAFARMQQGTGGLVQSYAVLASTLFALGAAFRVMQNAADFQALQASQLAFAEVTGANMKQLTADVQAATRSQVDLQKAGSSTAIMFAKGFSSEQMVAVADASTKASIALGRNFEDTFNRIVQGTTKAEPELLDELGITLRLETATRRYAASIGKTREELTTYEKSQAVLNETLRQAESNFSAIGDKVPVNQLNQLATTFSDLMQSILGVITPLANFFANVLNKNIVAAIAVIGLFAKSMGGEILGALGVDIESFTTNTAARMERLAASVTQSTAKMKAGFSAFKSGGFSPEALAADTQGAAKKLARGSKSPVLKRAAKGTMSGTDKANLSKALKSAEQQYQKHGKIVSGIFKGKDIAVVRSLELSFAKQRMSVKGFEGVSRRVAATVQGAFVASFNVIKVAGQGTFLLLSKAAQGFGKVANRVLGAAGTIGIVLLVIQGLIAAFNSWRSIVAGFIKIWAKLLEGLGGLAGFFGFEKAQKGLQGMAESARDSARAYEDAQKEIDREKEKLEELAKSAENARQKLIDLENMRNPIIGIDQLTSVDDLVKLGNAIGTSGLADHIKKINEATADQKTTKGYRDLVYHTTAYFDKLKILYPELQQFKDITQLSDKQLAELDSTINKASSNFGQFKNNIKETVEQVENLRKEYVTLAAGTTFDKEANAARKLAGALQLASEKARNLKVIGEGTLSQLEGILGINLDYLKGLENQVELAQELLDAHLKMVKTLADEEHLTKRIAALRDRENKKLGALNTRTNKYVAKQNDLLVMRRELSDLIDKQNFAERVALDLTDGRSATEAKVLETHNDQIEAKEAQIKLLENELSLVQRIGDTFIESFEQSASTNLTDAILGTKKAYQAVDAIRNAMKKAVTQELVNSFLVDPMTKGMSRLLQKASEAMDPDSMLKKILTKELTPEEKAAKQTQEALVTHAQNLATILGQHATAIATSMGVPNAGVSDPTGGAGSGPGGDGTGDDNKKNIDSKTGQTIGEQIEEVITKGTNTGGTGFSAMFGDLGKTIDTFGGNLMGLLKGDGTGLFGKGEGGANSLFGDLFADMFGEGGMMKNFMGNLMGEGGIGGALQGLLGGGGTGGLLGGLMGGSGGGILGGLLGGGGGGMMGLLKPLLGMIPGIGPLLSMLPFAKGGLIGNKMPIGLANGGIMPRYAKGGIATQPTYLVGEGKQNEAVVPLPDNKSIPVDLGKGANATNNTSINVNIDGSGASADVTADGGSALAEAINASVMSTIMKEQAPGGILNPTG
jgi:hypothetical protein